MFRSNIGIRPTLKAPVPKKTQNNKPCPVCKLTFCSNKKHKSRD